MSEIMTRLLDTPPNAQIRVSQASNKLLGGYSGIIINIDIEQNLRVLDKASNIRIHNNQKGSGPLRTSVTLGILVSQKYGIIGAIVSSVVVYYRYSSVASHGVV